VRANKLAQIEQVKVRISKLRKQRKSRIDPYVTYRWLRSAVLRRTPKRLITKRALRKVRRSPVRKKGVKGNVKKKSKPQMPKKFLNKLLGSDLKQLKDEFDLHEKELRKRLRRKKVTKAVFRVEKAKLVNAHEEKIKSLKRRKLKKLKDERRVSASLKSSVTDTRIKKIQNRKRSLKRRKLKDVRRVLVILKSSTRLKQSQKVRRSLLSKYISVVGLVSSSLVRNARRSHKSKIRKMILLSKKLKTLKFKHSIRKYSYRDRLRRLKPSQEARKTKHITSKTSQRIRIHETLSTGSVIKSYLHKGVLYRPRPKRKRTITPRNYKPNRHIKLLNKKLSQLYLQLHTLKIKNVSKLFRRVNILKVRTLSYRRLKSKLLLR